MPPPLVTSSLLPPGVLRLHIHLVRLHDTDHAGIRQAAPLFPEGAIRKFPWCPSPYPAQTLSWKGILSRRELSNCSPLATACTDAESAQLLWSQQRNNSSRGHGPEGWKDGLSQPQLVEWGGGSSSKKKVLCNRNEPIRDQNSTEQVPKRIKSTIKAAVIKNHASFFFVVHLFGFLVGRNTRLILEPTAGLSNSFIMLCWKFILRKHEFSKSQKFSFLLRSS